LDTRPSFCLPPLECCRGVRLIQAANSRPDLNAPGSAMVAAIADAVIGPMPGMVASRQLTAFALLLAHDDRLNHLDGLSSACSSAIRLLSASRANAGTSASSASRTD
jgi:hypothetical protein